jgi:hypothetical protein
VVSQWVGAALSDEAAKPANASCELTTEDRDTFAKLVGMLGGNGDKRFIMMTKDMFGICRGTQTRDALLSYVMR